MWVLWYNYYPTNTDTTIATLLVMGGRILDCSKHPQLPKNTTWSSPSLELTLAFFEAQSNW